MARRLRVAPGAGHTLHMAAETIHIAPALPPAPSSSPPQGIADPLPPSASDPLLPADPVWVRPRGRIDVHVTLVAPGASTFDGAALANAPKFKSLNHLAATVPDLEGRSAVNGRFYARVKTASHVSMEELENALSALPENADLTVALDPTDD